MPRPNLLDHPIVSERYFFPRPTPPLEPRVVTTRGGCELWCAVSDAASSKTVVHFHGNGEVVRDWQPLLGPFFVELGWSTVFVEYRGYGGSPGAPRLASMLDDGEDVVRALGLDPGQTVAFGRSVGSLYAVELCKRLPLAGLILDSGVNDLVERLLLRVSPEELGVSDEELCAEIGERFDQSAKLQAFRGPTLLLHAGDDDLVSLAHAERNAAACHDGKLHVFPRGGHNAIFAMNQAEYLAQIRDFLAGL